MGAVAQSLEVNSHNELRQNNKSNIFVPASDSVYGFSNVAMNPNTSFDKFVKSPKVNTRLNIQRKQGNRIMYNNTQLMSNNTS